MSYKGVPTFVRGAICLGSKEVRSDVGQFLLKAIIVRFVVPIYFFLGGSLFLSGLSVDSMKTAS